MERLMAGGGMKVDSKPKPVRMRQGWDLACRWRDASSLEQEEEFH